MTLKILKYPNESLDNATQPVLEVDDHLINEIHEMFDIMYNSNGVGLAANQVGLDKSVLVFDCSEDGESPTCMINPVIKSFSGTATFQEGCLSFPGISLFVSRSQKIIVDYLDINSEKVTKTFKGLEAICIQHEIDHLHGKTFLNRVNRQARRSALRNLRRKK